MEGGKGGKMTTADIRSLSFFFGVVSQRKEELVQEHVLMIRDIPWTLSKMLTSTNVRKLSNFKKEQVKGQDK
jgi:hypothetical protein